MYNDFVTINGKLYSFIDRKCSEIKQGSSPTRSLNGTLNIDILSTVNKKELSFTFEVEDRGLLRLRDLWRLNSSYPMTDWDNSSCTVTCTNLSFDENFIGFDGESHWFNVSLDFKQI